MERKLTAIFSADVAGYSRLIEKDAIGILQVLTPYLQMMTERVQHHGGHAVGSRGDSLLAEFPSVIEAVQCAVELQHELKTRNAALPAERRIVFRMGINLGEVVSEHGQLQGDGINIAVRLESVADAGGILLSGTVYDQVEHKLPFRYEYLGEQQVKNIRKPVRAYRGRWEESDSPQSPVHSAKRKVESPKEQAWFQTAPTNNLEAYEYYLRGWQLGWRTTKETNIQARQMFEKAIELDPQYAGTYAGLGFTYFMEWFSQWSADPQNLTRADEMPQKAVTLDDSLPLVHASLSVIKLWQKQYTQATTEIERALALDPNSVTGYDHLALLLMSVGRAEEAIEAAAQDGFLRVIDESGEDYLYPAEYFIPVELPDEVLQALALSA